jgi:hypothetical protein
MRVIIKRQVVPFEWLMLPEQGRWSDKECRKFNARLVAEGTGRVYFSFKPVDVQFDPAAYTWNDYDAAVAIYSILVTEAGQTDLALQINVGLQINSSTYRANAGLSQSAFEDYMYYIQALCFQAFSEAENYAIPVDLSSHRIDLWTNNTPVSLLNVSRVVSDKRKPSKSSRSSRHRDSSSSSSSNSSDDDASKRRSKKVPKRSKDEWPRGKTDSARPVSSSHAPSKPATSKPENRQSKPRLPL